MSRSDPDAEKESLIRIELDTPSTAPPVHKLAWLEGLRAVAALIVTVFHAIRVLGFTLVGIGSHWYELPVLRAFCSGELAVTIFFCLSGCVLSMRPLQLAGSRTPQELSDARAAIASGAIRRLPRLAITPFVVCVFSSLLIFCGGKRWTMPNPTGTHLLNLLPKDRWPFWQELKLGLFDVVDIFTKDEHKGSVSRYIVVAWTLSWEAVGSLYVFAWTTALVGARRGVRYGSLAILIAACYKQASNWIACFFLGIACAEAIIATNSWSGSLANTVGAVLLLVGLFTGGAPSTHVGPNEWQRAAWSRWLHSVHSQNIDWIVIGSALILIGCSLLSFARRALSWWPLLWLGKNSYALYLTHVGLLQMLAAGIMRQLLDRGASFRLAATVAMVLWVPATLLVTSLLTTYVDQPALALSRRFERWAMS